MESANVANRSFWLPYATVLTWIRAGVRGNRKMATVKNPFHPHRRFPYWVNRLALAAMLALVVMPTAGRLSQAGIGVESTRAGSIDGGAVVTAAPAGHDHASAAGQPSRPAPAAPGERHATHADCPYCPLLGQLAGAAHPLPLPAAAPADPAPPLAVAAGHAGLRLHGLHARGPPAAA